MRCEHCGTQAFTPFTVIETWRYPNGETFQREHAACCYEHAQRIVFYQGCRLPEHAPIAAVAGDTSPNSD